MTPPRTGGRVRPVAVGDAIALRLRRAARRVGRDERGFTAAEFAAGVGLLVLPVAILVMSLPVWAATQEAGRVAAQQAARAIVTASDHASGLARAEALATEVLANLGVERVGALEVDGTLAPTPATAPQELVTVTVIVRMPALALPLVGEWAAFDHRVSHTQPVDRYRSHPRGA